MELANYNWTMSKLPTGTFINMGTIIVGSLIGLMIKQVFPESINTITQQAVALGILIIGIQMSIKVPDELLIVFIISLIIGGIIGETISVKGMLDTCEYWMRENFALKHPRFAEGFIYAFILFGANPITIVGAIEEGINGKRELLLIKSVLDGVTAIALTSAYDIGIIVTVIPLLIIQGGFTLLGSKASGWFTKNVLAQISAVGGVLLIALSMKILLDADIRVANLLPALIVVVLLTGGVKRLGWKI